LYNVIVNLKQKGELKMETKDLTLEQLEALIEAKKAELEERKAKERANAIETCKNLIQNFGLTKEELFSIKLSDLKTGWYKLADGTTKGYITKEKGNTPKWITTAHFVKPFTPEELLAQQIKDKKISELRAAAAKAKQTKTKTETTKE
jgi:DNA-binding protein H-NS